MTVVLYLLKDGDGEGAEDLRLSLRSLDHAFPDEDIAVALATAEPPPWFAGRHVEAHDIPGAGKHWSMMGKVCAAIETLGLDRPFLLSADDHVAPLEPPCRLADWPYTARNLSLDAFLAVSKGNVSWRRSFAWARDVISRRYGAPPTPLVMCPHRNSWLDPRCLPAVKDLFPFPETPPDDPAARFGPSPDDTFGAVAIAEGFVPESRYVRIKDVKKGDPAQFFGAYLSDDAPGRHGISMPPRADAVRRSLLRIFRRPSRWERT